MKRVAVLITFFLLCTLQSTAAAAGGTIVVSAAVEKKGTIIKPLGNFLYVEKASPVILVTVENTSKEPQKLYGDDLIGELSHVSFKVLDRLKTRKLINNKTPIPGSDAAEFQTLKPGEIRQYEILLDLEKWNKTIKTHGRNAGAFKATVHIHTGPRSICSPHYDMIVTEKRLIP